MCSLGWHPCWNDGAEPGARNELCAVNHNLPYKQRERHEQKATIVCGLKRKIKSLRYNTPLSGIYLHLSERSLQLWCSAGFLMWPEWHIFHSSPFFTRSHFTIRAVSFQCSFVPWPTCSCKPTPTRDCQGRGGWCREDEDVKWERWSHKDSVNESTFTCMHQRLIPPGWTGQMLSGRQPLVNFYN